MKFKSLRQFQYSRTSTLILLNKLDEEIWDHQPEGFPNTLRWNAGHVYSTAEDFLNDADQAYKITLPDWHNFFIDGTRPSEWTEKAPSKEAIIAALEEQEDRISKHFKDILERDASTVRDVNGMGLDTVDASMQFVTWHEGIHLGVMNALSKILK